MGEIESAWGRYPDYRIDIVPCTATAQAWLGDLLLAESDSCLRLEETKHVDRLYFPERDVRWELFEPTDLPVQRASRLLDRQPERPA
jgi:acyl-CoA thioesterase-2